MSSEVSPLLQAQSPAVSVQSSPSQSSPSDTVRRKFLAIVGPALDWRQYSFEFWLCTLIRFLVAIGSFAVDSPSYILVRRAVCAAEGGGPHCGGNDLLGKDFFIQLYILTFSYLFAIIIHIPMGFVIDKRGKRLALVLNGGSTVLYYGTIAVVAAVRVIPKRLFCLAPFFLLLGGGPWTTRSLVFTAVNDRLTSQQRIPAFSIMEGISIIGTGIAMILVRFTLDSDPWLLFLVGGIMFFLAFMLAFFIKGPINGGLQGDVTGEDPSLTTEHLITEPEPLLDDIPHDSQTAEVPTLETSTQWKPKIRYACFGAFFLLSAAKSSDTFVLWAGPRFDKTRDYYDFLTVLRLILQLVLYFILLPLAAFYLTETRGMNPSAKDLALSMGSVLLYILGICVTQFAPNLPIIIFGLFLAVLGWGAYVTLLSFVASIVDRRILGRVFTAISAISMIGNIGGLLALWGMYEWMRKLNIETERHEFILSEIVHLIILVLLRNLYKTQGRVSG